MASLILLGLQCNRELLFQELLDNKESNWKGGRY